MEPEKLKPQVNFRTPPPVQARVDDDLVDEWIVQGNKAIRQRREPRQVTFTPFNAGCPVDLNRNGARRVTHSINVETGEIEDLEGDLEKTPSTLTFTNWGQNVITSNGLGGLSLSRAEKDPLPTL